MRLNDGGGRKGRDGNRGEGSTNMWLEEEEEFTEQTQKTVLGGENDEKILRRKCNQPCPISQR